MASNLKVYSFEEVEKHDKLKDCWVIINGKVYDLSPFMSEHPGGEEVLLSSTGKDATADYEDIGHSDYAKELMNKYCIGKIDMSTVPQKRFHIPLDPPYDSDKISSVIKILKTLLPILILVLAYAVWQSVQHLNV